MQELNGVRSGIRHLSVVNTKCLNLKCNSTIRRRVRNHFPLWTRHIYIHWFCYSFHTKEIFVFCLSGLNQAGLNWKKVMSFTSMGQSRLTVLTLGAVYFERPMSIKPISNQYQTNNAVLKHIHRLSAVDDVVMERDFVVLNNMANWGSDWRLRRGWDLQSSCRVAGRK